MVAGGNLHDDAGHPAVDGKLHVAHHAPAKGVDLAVESSRSDPSHRIFVGRRNGRESRLDSMDARFGQGLGDPQFLVGAQFYARLLLAVPKGHIMDLDLRGEIE
jgi:hypothetical protein